MIVEVQVYPPEAAAAGCSAAMVADGPPKGATEGTLTWSRQDYLYTANEAAHWHFDRFEGMASHVSLVSGEESDRYDVSFVWQTNPYSSVSGRTDSTGADFEWTIKSTNYDIGAAESMTSVVAVFRYRSPPGNEILSGASSRKILCRTTGEILCGGRDLELTS